MAKGIKVKIDNPQKTMKRLISDDVRLYLAETWAKYFKKYTPMDSGTLGSTYETEPGKVTYTTPYAHFQWYGEVMVDDRGSTWAKPRTSKHYAGRNLVYSKEKNAKATSHWEEAAQKDCSSKVAAEVSDYIRRK
jgi:hypothetical protein